MPSRREINIKISVSTHPCQVIGLKPHPRRLLPNQGSLVILLIIIHSPDFFSKFLFYQQGYNNI